MYFQQISITFKRLCTTWLYCNLLRYWFCYTEWSTHDDVIKWKHFPRDWPFVWGIHRSRWIPHTKASDAELFMFTLICVWINGWVNNREAGDLRRYRGHYDVIVMQFAWKKELMAIKRNVQYNKSILPYRIKPNLPMFYICWRQLYVWT